MPFRVHCPAHRRTTNDERRTTNALGFGYAVVVRRSSFVRRSFVVRSSFVVFFVVRRSFVRRSFVVRCRPSFVCWFFLSFVHSSFAVAVTPSPNASSSPPFVAFLIVRQSLAVRCLVVATSVCAVSERGLIDLLKYHSPQSVDWGESSSKPSASTYNVHACACNDRLGRSNWVFSERCCGGQQRDDWASLSLVGRSDARDGQQ